MTAKANGKTAEAPAPAAEMRNAEGEHQDGLLIPVLWDEQGVVRVGNVVPSGDVRPGEIEFILKEALLYMARGFGRP